MSLPGFTAQAALRRTSFRVTPALPLAHGSRQAEWRAITPQQQADICHTVTGPCTHQWPWFAGTQCATGASGFQQCCSSAFQYPWIRECQNPDGSWRMEGSGCGFCI